MTQQIINTASVTEEQLARCHRILDLNTNEVFYLVESERDPLVEYTVRYLRDKHAYTCTCSEGQEGFVHCRYGYCKHVRWSVAHAQQFKAEQKFLQAREARVERLTRLGLTEREARQAVAAYFLVDGKPADDATLVRVFGPHKQPSKWEVEADSRRYQGCTFSLLK